MKPFPLSKRGLLCFISSVFDPLGLLTPSMLEAKLILKQLWKISLDWDEEIPSNLNNRWLKWLQTFKKLRKLNYPDGMDFHLKTLKI